MSNKFYLACFRDNVGSNVSFNCQNMRGYSTDLNRAHMATLKQAQQFYNDSRGYDCPIAVDLVDSMAVWKVDHQYIPISSTVDPDCFTYVAFEKRGKGIRTDGNDVYWLNTESGTTSTNFEHASQLILLEAKRLDPDQYVFISFHKAEQAKRRTFNMSRFDLQSMVLDQGLIMPEHLKIKKRKQTTGKTRFNCPGCGRIHWQHNPEFMGCTNTDCQEWSVFV